jgi:chromosome segregation protein
VGEGDAALEAARARLRALREGGETLRREVARLEEKRSQAAVLLVRIRERRRVVEDERLRAAEAHRRALASLGQIQTYEQRLASLLPPLRELATVVEGLRAAACRAADVLDERAAASRESSDAFAGTLRDLGRREAELQRELVGLGEGLVDVQVRMAHLQDQGEERERALAELRRRHQSPRDVGPDAAAGQTVEGLRAAGERLERQRERLGPVNPLAQQEYRETVERADFLAEQRRDLEASLAELRQVVEELDEHIETTFTAVFEATRVHFESMVEVLFPGGRGVLKLVDVGPGGGGEDEEEEASTEADEEEDRDAGGGGGRLQGVALEVKPPRKAPRSLTLLSGGEKALAAIAFLFALFLARPCPFYILDEVEAALDDVNIGRFLSLVRRYQGQTQFIIITHQRRTMEVADSLFGVAMDPDGTSRVLSRRMVQEGSSRS